MIDDRRRHISSPATLLAYFDQLPARVLLDRLPTPMLAVGLNGAVAYTNTALCSLLGFTEQASPVDLQLSQLLIGHPRPPLTGPIHALRASAGSVTSWAHCDGSTVRAVVSESMMMRDDDPVLLVGLSDVTEWEWITGPQFPPDRLGR